MLDGLFEQLTEHPKLKAWGAQVELLLEQLNRIEHKVDFLVRRQQEADARLVPLRGPPAAGKKRGD